MDDRLRILFSIGSMGGGGSERQLIGILQHLDRAAFAPMLYTCGSGGELLGEVPKDVPVLAFEEPARPILLSYPGRVHLAQVRRLANVIQSQRIRLLYSRTYLMAMIAYGAARRTGVPWVTVEVADPKCALEENTTRFLRTKRWLLRRAYQHANRVIANSEGVRRGLIDYYRLPAKTITTLYNFVDIERIDREVSLPGPILEVGRFHVVCAGRLQPQKGYTFFLQAIDELVNNRGRKELVAHILGQGPQEGELKRFAQERGLGGHVDFAGYVSQPCAYFRQAHLFCLPSLYEGMPNALLEAMACRAPVLATDCPSGPREILEDGKLGRLVPPGDALALADAIQDALDNRDKWLAIVPAARKRIEEDFSAANGIARLEQLLKEVASGASHSR